MKQIDLLIVGAGPVGLCFARSLTGTGLSITMVDPQPRQALADPAFDGREIALTHASRAIMETLGLWALIDAGEVSPLRDAKVMNGSSPFSLTFSAQRRGSEDLGWLLPNHLIRRAAWQVTCDQERLELLDGVSVKALTPGPERTSATLSNGEQISARLVVAADGRFSATRRMMGIGAQTRDFGKTMLVCRMRHERPHHHAAWEWFGYGKTLALLPLNGDRAGAVMTLSPQEIQTLQTMDADAFGEVVTRLFEHRLGPMIQDGSRHAYPLVGVYAQRFVGQRFALIGDAAVGMHPVTAHGFNFGLQGQARLAQAVRQAAADQDIGAASILSGYERGHRLATRPLYEATNAIAALYTDDRLPARALRNAALRLANSIPPFKRAIAAHLTQHRT